MGKTDCQECKLYQAAGELIEKEDSNDVAGLPPKIEIATIKI